MVLTLLALTTEAKKAIHFYMKESSSNNHGADYEDKAPGREGNCLTVVVIVLME